MIKVLEMTLSGGPGADETPACEALQALISVVAEHPHVMRPHIEAVCRVMLIIVDRDAFDDETRKLGLEFIPSFANFILVRVGDGQRVFSELQKLGVIVRPMGGYQLPEWIRISVGTPKENQRCLEALNAALACAQPSTV